MVVEPDQLQVDVVVDVVDFIPDCHPVVVGRHVGVFHQFGELDEGVFGLLGRTDYEAVERVERIEEEMGIDLSLVERQLGLVALVFHDALQQHAVVEFLDESYDKRVGQNDEEHEPYGYGHIVVSDPCLIFAHGGNHEIHFRERVQRQKICEQQECGEYDGQP